MTLTSELVAAVRARAEGTPYVLGETPEGFDVRLELDNPRWTGQFREWQLTEASIHHVQLDEASRTFMVTDEVWALSWRAGVDGRERPVMAASRGMTSGRVKTWTFQRTYSLGRGGLTKESDVTFDSSAGRELAVDAARALGWKLRRGLDETSGSTSASSRSCCSFSPGIVVGIVALAGGFS